MREKLQIINGCWWFLHGDHWQPLIDFPAIMPRKEVAVKASERMEQFRQECKESKEFRYVEGRKL